MQLNHTYLAAMYQQLANLHLEVAKAQDERDAALAEKDIAVSHLQEMQRQRDDARNQVQELRYDGVDRQS